MFGLSSGNVLVRFWERLKLGEKQKVRGNRERKERVVKYQSTIRESERHGRRVDGQGRGARPGQNRTAGSSSGLGTGQGLPAVSDAVGQVPTTGLLRSLLAGDWEECVNPPSPCWARISTDWARVACWADSFADDGLPAVGARSNSLVKYKLLTPGPAVGHPTAQRQWLRRQFIFFSSCVCYWEAECESSGTETSSAECGTVTSIATRRVLGVPVTAGRLGGAIAGGFRLLICTFFWLLFCR